MSQQQDFDSKLLKVIIKKSDDEPFNEYLNRVQPHLTNFPEEVIREWLYRHDNFIQRFGHHDLVHWSFEEAKFTTQEILDIKLFPSKLDHVINAGNNIWRHPMIKDYEPALSLRQKGTFPSPIIIFEDAGNYYDFTGENYLVPFHLAEGHKRYGQLKAIVDYPKRCQLVKPLLDSHNVYLLKMNGQV
ncbi:hypothetical protein GCM10009128_12690 [Psychrosphaera haliotis]|uniref:hypothetical protein n=1 Tax=Psychrosphaera haliotis TaxID=555083 RepID=UPI0031CE9342